MKLSIIKVRFWVIALECGHERIVIKPSHIESHNRAKMHCPDCDGHVRVSEAVRGLEAGRMLRTSNGTLRGL